MMMARSMRRALLVLATLTCLMINSGLAFTFHSQQMPSNADTATHRRRSKLFVTPPDSAPVVSRRSIFQSIPVIATGILISSKPVLAVNGVEAASPTLEDLLYTILRVREAVVQESRLITGGRFKDAQRANVKLAVRFILKNYKLPDTVIAASAFIEDNNRRVAAGNVGQQAAQDLYTILEYFDAQDVQNLKVGNADGMAGKETLVLKGLDASRRNLDDFLAYFSPKTVDAAKERLLTENELNRKEWDPALGDIFNLPPPV